ncbi:MAG: MBL fold metallo-hydrolase [Novosphingobium sp.]
MLNKVCLAALAGLVVSTGPAFAAQACPGLRWVTLGTAGGPVPTPERAEPSNLLIAGDEQVLVDTGDGTVNQLAKAGFDLRPVRTVFLSHHHMDHTGGLPAVIGLRWMNTMPGRLTVYGPPGTREIVDGAIRAMQPQARVGFGLGTASTPPEASVDVREIAAGDTVHIGALTVTAAGNSHFDHPGPRQANEPQSLSYRFDFAGRSITYTGDTGPSASVTTLAKGSDLLVSEVILLEPIIASIKKQRPDMSNEVFGQMRQHLSTHHIVAADIGTMAATAGVGRVLLTHFAAPPGPIARHARAFRADIGRAYAGPVSVAQDLSSLSVPCK